ncbi:MAG TPA: stress response translation initiation inhibitor YciH [Thermoanaerobaculia bacterium]|jgi:translation initiation factor 1|nr:stress response translation initiation inhibitor YciH [Thermoanaerobaculia bacterium]
MTGRVVYSSEKGRICPKCGWAAADCRCAGNLARPEEAVPEKIKATLNLENAGPGKKVTVIHGLPKNTEFLESLAKELKKACGAGGKAGDGLVELQGDQRERLRDLLSQRGWTIKG